MSTLGTVERPLCVAVIGSGPSGFYAAEALLKAPNLTVRVDVFDRLPTPFGMVRGGVAPDHQNIKGVTATYEKVASDARVPVTATQCEATTDKTGGIMQEA